MSRTFCWSKGLALGASEANAIVVGEDGRSLKLSFTEELDTIPNISDYQLSVTDPVGVNPVNAVNLANANISTNMYNI